MKKDALARLVRELVKEAKICYNQRGEMKGLEEWASIYKEKEIQMIYNYICYKNGSALMRIIRIDNLIEKEILEFCYKNLNLGH